MQYDRIINKHPPQYLSITVFPLYILEEARSPAAAEETCWAPGSGSECRKTAEVYGGFYLGT